MKSSIPTPLPKEINGLGTLVKWFPKSREAIFRRLRRNTDTYRVIGPYSNGITLLRQTFHGGNSEYTAVTRDGTIIGYYFVNNYLRGRDAIGAENAGELLKTKVSFLPFPR